MTAVDEVEVESSVMGASSSWRRIGYEFMVDSEE